MEYVAFLLLGRTDSLTLGIDWRIVWSMGITHSSFLAEVAITSEKPSVMTVESTVVTVGSVVVSVVSLSTEML